MSAVMESITSKVLYNRELAPGLFTIGLEWKGVSVLPGQFVMLRVSDSLDPLLRRPFGVYKVLSSKSVKSTGAFKGSGIEVLYSVVGRGTALLAARVVGDSVGILGPIGNGFPLPSKKQKLIMVAGSVGTAPFYLLAKKLGRDSTLIVGARGVEARALARDFKALKCRIEIATEDGSVGTKGLVTDLLKKELLKEKSESSVVYACGPTGMLRAVTAVAEAAGVEAYVSLERSMACGIGVCLGCAVKGVPHEPRPGRPPEYAMVCSDGPVFKGSDIEWENL
ncbi:MAG: dihydroorotate dehydrogenase electron transfer subunit [Proteobacteria bacterium]|nr:dihydroorotate dehydrogenase electron transfer subunit [Pseudomonadota bacterium]